MISKIKSLQNHQGFMRYFKNTPDKIILFGSYAYGTPTEDSDIDLFLLKDDLTIEETRYYQREDYFYKVDILQNGKVWYERTSS